MSDPALDLRNHVARLLLRDLAAMRRELDAYADDAGPWRVVPGLTNAGGTLALHIAGNLQTYIGAVIGGTGYVRDRDREFSRRDVPRAELMQGLDDAAQAVQKGMLALDPSRLSEPYPLEINTHTVRTDMFLLHLATHLAYHLGQLDYHRRTVTGSADTVNTVSVSALNEPWP